MRNVVAAACSLSALLVAAPSLAQAPNDVVVMRRAIAPSVFSMHEWERSEWTVAPSCSVNAAASRVIRCVEKTSRKVVGDERCSGAKGAETSTMPSYATCPVSWIPVSYGPYAEACSDLTTRTVERSCVQTRPAEVIPATGCVGSSSTTEKVSNHSGCDYSWAQRPGLCSGDGVRAVTPYCARSGGSSAPADVPDSYCASKPRPGDTMADATCATTKASCSLTHQRFLTVRSTADLPVPVTITSSGLSDAQNKASRICEATKDVTACMLRYVSPGENKVYVYTSPYNLYSSTGTLYEGWYGGTCNTY